MKLGNGLNLLESPNGCWFFAGRVPMILAWKRKDGEDLSENDVDTILHCMAPALFGYTSVSFPTKKEACGAVLSYWAKAEIASLSPEIEQMLRTAKNEAI